MIEGCGYEPDCSSPCKLVSSVLLLLMYMGQEGLTGTGMRIFGVACNRRVLTIEGWVLMIGWERSNGTARDRRSGEAAAACWRSMLAARKRVDCMVAGGEVVCTEGVKGVEGSERTGVVSRELERRTSAWRRARTTRVGVPGTSRLHHP